MHEFYCLLLLLLLKVRWADQQVEKIRRKRGIISTDDIETRAYNDLHFNDPLWNKEWYLVRSQTNEVLKFKNNHLLAMFLNNSSHFVL